eukprot:364201-Chlamydomonas_euryale.AAC.2
MHASACSTHPLILQGEVCAPSFATPPGRRRTVLACMHRPALHMSHMAALLSLHARNPRQHAKCCKAGYWVLTCGRCHARAMQGNRCHSSMQGTCKEIGATVPCKGHARTSVPRCHARDMQGNPLLDTHPHTCFLPAAVRFGETYTRILPCAQRQQVRPHAHPLAADQCVSSCPRGNPLVRPPLCLLPAQIYIMAARAALNLSYQEKTPVAGQPECLLELKGQDLIGTPLASPNAVHARVYVLPLLTILMNKGTGIVTSVPSDSPDDYMALSDLKKKPKLREKFGVSDEWVMPFDVIPIIDVPELGNMAAVKVRAGGGDIEEHWRMQARLDSRQCWISTTPGLPVPYIAGMSTAGRNRREAADGERHDARPACVFWLLE